MVRSNADPVLTPSTIKDAKPGKASVSVFGLELAGSRVRFESDSAGIINALRRRYRVFACGGGGLTFRVSAAAGRGLPFRPAVRAAGPCLELGRGDFRATVDLSSGSGDLAASPNEQCLDAFLRSLISSLLLRSRGLMLHSAGLVKDGRAHIFLGRSGAGKSTLSRLAASAGCEVISDEINMLRREKGRWRVYGSPFWGEMRAAGRQGSWPLGGLYLLRKARSNGVAACGMGEALGSLLRCLLNFEKGPGISGLVMENAMSLLGRVKPVKLEFSKRDASFLELI